MEDQEFIENIPANESQLTQNRRIYPKNMKGGKEEWRGLEIHQQELNQELGSLERQIKDLKKNDLSSNYNAKIIEQLEQRQAFLENKKQEGELMKLKGKEFEEEMRRIRADRDNFRSYMKQTYDYLVTEKQQNKKLELEEKLNYENALLEYNRQRLESEKRRRMENKLNLKKDINDQLELANERNKQKLMERYNNQQELVQLNNERALKEIMKEESYKKFYQQWSENDEKLKQVHANLVTNQNQAKDKQMEQIINKQVEEYKMKLFQDEMNRVQKFQNDKNMVVNTNNEQLKYKMSQKEMENMERKMNQEQRLNDLKAYNDYIQQQKQEKLERQRQYQNSLQRQADENNQKKINSNKMTVAEKRFNFQDLQAYKDVNPQSFSQLIGYSPQIGAYSNRVKVIPDTNNNPAASSFGQTINKIKSLSPGVKRPEGVDFFPQSNILPNSTKNATISTKNNIFGDPMPEQNNNPLRKTPINQIPVNQSGHNPLTNPLPTNIQNPYIAREYSKVQNSKNIFSNVADRNLINKT